MKPLTRARGGTTADAGFRDVMGPRTVREWREVARPLIAANVQPANVRWIDPHDAQSLLHVEPIAGATRDAPSEDANESNETPSTKRAKSPVRVPPAYLDAAAMVLCHRDPTRWDALYRVLSRISRGEHRLFSDASDADVHRVLMLAKGVKRDAHKMKAFVRFRRVMSVVDGATTAHYVAWHRPDFRILPLVAPFFARRFSVMHWTILTPTGSVTWDTRELVFGPPATSRDAPSEDALEDVWRTYYANIFNPARINPRAMKREMPVRYWGTLPEAQVIDELLQKAPKRVEGMMAARVGDDRGAGVYVPRGPDVSLTVLREAARGCRGCDLCEVGTQTVFGEGPGDARVVMVGEQPGDQEDVQGRPFVGPAGELLNRALLDAGLRREEIYITNAVKHFKWTPDPRGKRRIHAKPNALEVRACRPWLDEELKLVKPKVLVLLGATAGQALLGASFRVNASRGRVLTDTALSPLLVIATIHPSAILRTPEDLREREYQAMVSDLRLVAAAAAEI